MYVWFCFICQKLQHRFFIDCSSVLDDAFVNTGDKASFRRFDGIVGIEGEQFRHQIFVLPTFCDQRSVLFIAVLKVQADHSGSSKDHLVFGDHNVGNIALGGNHIPGAVHLPNPGSHFSSIFGQHGDFITDRRLLIGEDHGQDIVQFGFHPGRHFPPVREANGQFVTRANREIRLYFGHQQTVDRNHDQRAMLRHHLRRIITQAGINRLDTADRLGL